MEWLQDLINTLLGSSIAWGTVIVLILAKVIPNKKIQEIFYGFGTFVTLGMTKFTWYEKVEEWFIDGLAVAVTAFIEGLRSDN